MVQKEVADRMMAKPGTKAYGAYTVCYSVLEGKRAAIEAEEPNRIIGDLSELKDIVKEDHYFTYNLK